MREALEKVKPPNGGREVPGLLPARRTPAPALHHFASYCFCRSGPVRSEGSGGGRCFEAEAQTQKLPDEPACRQVQPER